MHRRSSGLGGVHMRKSLFSAIFIACLIVFVPMVASAGTTSAPPTFDEAVKDYNAGQYQKALIKFQKFRDVNPNNLLVRYYQGLCFQGLNALDQASEEFKYVAIHDTHGELKSKAEIGLEHLKNAKTLTNAQQQALSYENKGNIKIVLLFVDRVRCKQCQEAGNAWNKVVKLRPTAWQPIFIENGDPRIEEYKVYKKHPYMVILGEPKPGSNIPTYGTNQNQDRPPSDTVLWAGVPPLNDRSLLNLIQRF